MASWEPESSGGRPFTVGSDPLPPLRPPETDEEYEAWRHRWVYGHDPVDYTLRRLIFTLVCVFWLAVCFLIVGLLLWL